jgi:hypothetical protein
MVSGAGSRTVVLDLDEDSARAGWIASYRPRGVAANTGSILAAPPNVMVSKVEAGLRLPARLLARPAGTMSERRQLGRSPQERAMRLRDDDGVELKAEYHVEKVDRRLTLVLESAGGRKGSGRNEDYVPVLRVLLERLRRLDGAITDGAVDSRETQHLPRDQRQLILADREYPVRLVDESNVEDLRLALTRSQRRVGQSATSLELLHNYGIDCVVQEASGFQRIAAPSWRRERARPLWTPGVEA